MALYSFIQSLCTTFGASIFEPVAVALAKENFAKVESQYVAGNSIYSDCQQSVQSIINALTVNPKPDKRKELEILRNSLHGTMNKLKPAKVDLFVQSATGKQSYLTLKQQNLIMAGMLDLQHELKVAEGVWDFLGGEGAYTELLDCFEQAGIILRPEYR